jgi:hypothetical protein
MLILFVPTAAHLTNHGPDLAPFQHDLIRNMILHQKLTTREMADAAGCSDRGKLRHPAQSSQTLHPHLHRLICLVLGRCEVDVPNKLMYKIYRNVQLGVLRGTVCYLES